MAPGEDIARPAAPRSRIAADSGWRVVHVIERFRVGGPAHALIGAAKYSGLAQSIRHKVVSLLAPDRRACDLAAAAGIPVVGAPDAGDLRQELSEADIVQLHFWNSPAVYAMIEQDLPAMRVLAWCHVNGETSPHILGKAIFSFADIVVVTAASTLDLPRFRAAEPSRISLVPGGADFSRLEGLRPVAHSDFNVGYIGAVDFIKLHPDFIRMSAAVNIPSIRFLVYGEGSARRELERQARELGVEERFIFHGYAEDIRPILSKLDVFGYPLCEGNSTTTELVLQEVMYAGIPAVVFPHGGAAAVVADGQNGILARDELDYVRAIEYLYRDPLERHRLGQNAARDAREKFGAQRSAHQLGAIYSRLMYEPKRVRRSAAEPLNAQCPDTTMSSPGAWALVRSLDGIGDRDFINSLTASNEDDAAAAEHRIALVSPQVSDIVMQYRLRYPRDPQLRLWSGLILTHRRRFALAASEFKMSLKLGCKCQRVELYFSECARKSGASEIADNAMHKTRVVFPSFPGFGRHDGLEEPCLD